MNSNIANLGSIPNDHMAVSGNTLDIASLGAVEDDHFAHMLRDQDQRDEQANYDAEDRDAVARDDDRDDGAEKTARSKQDEQDELQDRQDERDRNDQDRNDDSGRSNADAKSDETGPRISPANEVRADQLGSHANTNSAGPAQNEQQAGDKPQERQAGDGQAEQQNHQDNGQQTADAARTAAAVEMNNQHAADTLLNLVERDTPNPMQEQRIELPNTPDPLAAAALPNPLQGKSASGDVKGNSEGKGEVDGLKLGQQVQAQGEKQTTPRLRGGQAKHGGDIMPQGLPRPQVNQIAMGNAFGRQLAETLPQPQNPNTAPTPALTPAQTSAQTSAPAANAANVATTASTEGGAAIRELQLSITPDTGRAAADMPTLAVRPESKPAPTAPATATTPTPAATTTPAAIQTQTPPQTSSSPQSVVSQAMEGESAAKLVPLGEDSGKDGGKDGVKDGVKANGNNAASTTTSTSTANATAAAASKASAITQQTATADIRSPGIQVAMQLSKAVQNGMDRMTIRLDPAELGRVEVKLEVGHDGRVIALVAAERPETLEALRQDARSLERALQDAGLETDADSLNFSLDQGGQQGGALADDFGEGGNGRGIGDGDAGDDGEEPAAGDEILPRVVSNRALDISV